MRCASLRAVYALAMALYVYRVYAPGRGCCARVTPGRVRQVKNARVHTSSHSLPGTESRRAAQIRYSLKNRVRISDYVYDFQLTATFKRKC